MADNEWADWIGRSERVADQADPKPVRALAATFDSPAGAQPGDLLPGADVADRPRRSSKARWISTAPAARAAHVGRGALGFP